MVESRRFILSMLVTAGACGPTSPVEEQGSTSGTSTVSAGSSSAAEAAGSPTADVPTTTVATGDAGESDGSSESTGGPSPQDFPCEGARFVTIHGPGEFFEVLVDSRGHLYACGTTPTDGQMGGLVAEFDPAGALVRDTVVAVSDEVGAAFVSCDAVAADDRLPVLVNKQISPDSYHTVLQTYAPDGALAAEFAFADEPYPFWPLSLSVGLDGTSILTGQDAANTFIVQKRDSAGTLLWDQFGTDVGFQPHSISGAGHLVATLPPDRLLVVSGDDGTIVWETSWPLSGPGIADINDAGEVALAVNTDALELAVARFDPMGAPVGETRFTIHDQFDWITDVAINNVGGVAVSGYLQDPNQRTFVARLDAAGDLVAAHVCAATSLNGGYAVAIDDAGSVLVAGTVFPDNGPAQNFVAAFD